jgi:nucleoside-diphosphate-sugar epimerase
MKEKERVILLTGGSGLLGRNLIPLLEEQGWVVVAPSSSEMNITSVNEVFQALSWYNPSITVHCAAYTDVPLCETIEGARKANSVNIHGTKNVAEASHYFNSKMVYISSDYVYNGTGNHGVKDKTYPTTYYGMTKRIGESFCNEEDLVLRLSFKSRGTWGPHSYTQVVHPVRTNADFVDIIALKVRDAICKGLTGVKNLGTSAKYLKDLAESEYPEVKCVRPEEVSTPYNYPRNTTMKLDI